MRIAISSKEACGVFLIICWLVLPLTPCRSEDTAKARHAKGTGEKAYDPDRDVRKLLESLDVPKLLGHDGDFPMVPTYLDMFTTENLAKYYDNEGKAVPEAKVKLKRLFEASRRISIQKREDYFVEISSPLMQLLAQFYPDVRNLGREPGGGMRLSDIIKVIDADDRAKSGK